MESLGGGHSFRVCYSCSPALINQLSLEAEDQDGNWVDLVLLSRCPMSAQHLPCFPHLHCGSRDPKVGLDEFPLFLTGSACHNPFIVGTERAGKVGGCWVGLCCPAAEKEGPPPPVSRERPSCLCAEVEKYCCHGDGGVGAEPQM